MRWCPGLQQRQDRTVYVCGTDVPKRTVRGCESDAGLRQRVHSLRSGATCGQLQFRVGYEPCGYGKGATAGQHLLQRIHHHVRPRHHHLRESRR